MHELRKNKESSSIRCSVNSYLGIMKHYKSFNLRRKILSNNAWVFKAGYVQQCCSVFKLKNTPLVDIKTYQLFIGGS